MFRNKLHLPHKWEECVYSYKEMVWKQKIGNGLLTRERKGDYCLLSGVGLLRKTINVISVRYFPSFSYEISGCITLENSLCKIRFSYYILRSMYVIRQNFIEPY